MEQEIEIKKISDVVWEIPKSGSMKVPCRIFASEKLLEKMKQDRTLIQGKNVAFLPGIYKYSMIMPDGHSGYGFPIGGVAALDYEKGGISPGGIGYDINCLSGDSKILTNFGCKRKIKDLEFEFVEVKNPHSEYVLKSKKIYQSVISFDASLKSFSSKGINYFMKKKHLGSIIQIETQFGYTLKVTEEHPILTKKGMITAGNLTKDESLAINPFEGIEYKEIEDFPIISKELFSKEERNELEKRNLLPFSSKNTKLPLIAKLFGYLLGDGSIYLSGKKGFVNAYGSKEDLELIKQDFEELGFSAKVYSRIREHKIKDQYGEKEFITENYELHVSSKSLAKLFFALGYPEGIKTKIAFSIPYWIMKSPKWIKRLFLSGFFGAELSSPRTHTKTGFDCPVLSMNKNSFLIENGREFMIQIMQLLGEFNIKVDKISDRKEYKNKNGETSRIRLQISSEENNLIKLWSNIGFSYNLKREKLANIAILYIKEKKLLTSKRTELAEKVREFKKRGLKLKEVQSLLECAFANKRFIERHYYENASQRISLDFISFKEFTEQKVIELGRYGTFFDSIKEISRESYNDYVYDLNIDKTHNFIANNIVVSNCGVRLLKSSLTKEEVAPKAKELLDKLLEYCPAGLGSSNIRVDPEQINDILNKGAKWAVENGYGNEDDLKHSEEDGCMEQADAKAVSDLARKRGKKQIATLGSGNHFLEIQYVDKIFDKEVAEAFGLEEGKAIFIIHCGSRGLGHQVCSDYLRAMEHAFPEIVKGLPDRELIYAPSGSEMFNKYSKAMCAAANFAWCNRHVLGHQTRLAVKDVLGGAKLETVYDVAHNIAKVEEHDIDGEIKKVLVHRKGATRAFGPGRKEIPSVYRDVGQPIILPGSMGTSSYVLVGTNEGMKVTFGSTAHGAGRVMSRHEAIRTFRGENVVKELEAKGIHVKGVSWKGIAEEASGAYKDVDEVVKVSHDAGIGKIVVRLKPIGCIKG